jgi:hypothetical protein
MTEWDQLIAKACIDMHARAENGGDWPNGIPETFHKIKEIRQIQIAHERRTARRTARSRCLPGVNNWVLVVENIVKTEAVRIIAQTQIVIDETWGRLQAQMIAESKED